MPKKGKDSVPAKAPVDPAFHLSAVVESSDDAIVTKTLDGTITSWNNGAERVFGYTAEEIIGRNVSVLIPPERADEERRILKQIGAGQRVDHYQTLRRRQDGSLIDVSLTVSPIKDGTGKIIGASKIARDITEQVRALELLRRSEELFRVTLASIGDAVIATDRDGRVTYMNAVAEALTGWERHDALGRPLDQPFRIINEHSRQPVENPVAKVLRVGAVVGLGNDTLLVCKDGTERPIDDSAAPIRNAAGELVGIVLVFRDVTERHARAWEAQRLASIVTHAYDAIYSVSLTSDPAQEPVIQTWNRAAELLYGYTAEEIIGKPITMIIPADHLPLEGQILARLRKGEYVEPHETTRLTKAGRQFDVFVTASPLKDSAGRVVGGSKIARDITARKRDEEALRESQEQFHALADNIPQLAWMADEQGTMYWYNQRWYDYTGATPEEMRGSGWQKALHPEHVARVAARVQKSWDSGEPWEDVFPLRGKDGSYRWFLSRARPIRNAAGRVARWFGTSTDVNEQHAAEEALRHGALHDTLTDLPNRAYFVEQVSHALARMRRDPGSRFAVLFLDCDDFKQLNDSLGHATGDRFLTEVARRLRACVRPGDVVARLGGDEFTVLLEAITGAGDVERTARRIQDALAAPLSIEGTSVVVSMSIGAALGGPEHDQPQEVVRDADIAMYHAKQQGSGRFQLFDAALRDSAEARLSMEADLRLALERRDMRLVFQPIVELEAGKVRGFEALLRWHRPGHGVVAPRDFVALAEQTGLMIPIGSWVLREACRYARSWQDTSPEGAPVRVSVNLSAKQFRDPGIVDEVRTAVRDCGVAPSSLVLDIAERVLMENVESSKAVLPRLQDVGVEVHMDDFGTASSSITDMPRLPLQGIKLDNTLVHRVGSRRTDLEIARSIVDVVRRLGFGLIAEGVETVAQRERLIAFGCELGQGHLFAKPLEPEAVGALLAKHRKTGPSLTLRARSG